jgi:gamma-glutamyltranspeptidase/glutathione hydrolase
MTRAARALVGLAALGVVLGPLAAQELPTAKVARSRTGMVSSGSAQATAAGVWALSQGGNAADAAAAAAFALMVTDPANTSIGGRVQLLFRGADGALVPIDGATQVPRRVPPRTDPTRDRHGFATVPVPGAVAAIGRLVSQHGRLTLAQVLTPAIGLARDGYIVPPRLAGTWAAVAPALRRDPGTARHYLKPDGSPYLAGDRFVQPALAHLLTLIADSGTAVFYRGHAAATVAAEIRDGGGYADAADFASYRADDGVLVRTPYRGREVLSAGGRAWGNTLAELLNIRAEFPVDTAPASAREVELLARIIAQAIADRPQEVGSLAPKAGGFSLDQLSSREFGRRRAAEIRTAMSAGTLPSGAEETEDHDTSHLSVVDAEGNAVALTTSIGPSFGSRVASPAYGMLFAHSYRMRAEPVPGERDLTEMTPTIVLRDGRPELVLGGAGSERIPTAVFQVLSNVVDRGWDLERAMAAPRLFALGHQVRLHDWFSPALADSIRARGFEVEWVPLGASPHLGLVHAVWFDARSGTFVGVADAGDSGTAAGVRR